MKDIAIYGAGGFGREIYCSLVQMNIKNEQWNIIGFFDDGMQIGSKNEYGSILGGIKELNTWSEPLSILMAFGSQGLTKKIFEKIINPKISFPNIFFNTFFSDKQYFKCGKGNIILGGCCISCAVELGDFNIINTFVKIGHDVKIGSFNTFMPEVLISGETNIGDNNFFGIRSVVIQQITITDNIHLGAGAVLLTKPKKHSTYLGNPAKIFKY